MNDLPEVEGLLQQLTVFLFEISFVDEKLFGKFTRRSIQKFEKSVILLRYNNDICYLISKISAVEPEIPFFLKLFT